MILVMVAAHIYGRLLAIAVFSSRTAHKSREPSISHLRPAFTNKAIDNRVSTVFTATAFANL